MHQGVKHTIKKNSSYYLTLTVVGWVDVFTRQNHRNTLIEALDYCIKSKGLNVYAYCIMSNHIHLVVNASEPFILQDVLRDFKKFTAKKICAQIEEESESRREWMLNLFRFSAASSKKHKNYRFWQAGNHAIELYSEKFTWEKIDYIHNNPVAAGWVNKPEYWQYSSASNYAGLAENVLEHVACLKPLMRTL